MSSHARCNLLKSLMEMDLTLYHQLSDSQILTIKPASLNISEPTLMLLSLRSPKLELKVTQSLSSSS